MGFAAVDQSVKPLSIDGVKPSEQTVKDKTYAFSRFLHMFTKGEPKEPATSFLEFVLGDKFQKETVATEFVPVK